MASAKTAMLIFRSEPELKEAVRVASVNEHRSIANLIAVMIRDYCGRVSDRSVTTLPLALSPSHQR